MRNVPNWNSLNILGYNNKTKSQQFQENMSGEKRKPVTGLEVKHVNFVLEHTTHLQYKSDFIRLTWSLRVDTGYWE